MDWDTLTRLGSYLSLLTQQTLNCNNLDRTKVYVDVYSIGVIVVKIQCLCFLFFPTHSHAQACVVQSII